MLRLLWTLYKTSHFNSMALIQMRLLLWFLTCDLQWLGSGSYTATIHHCHGAIG